MKKNFLIAFAAGALFLIGNNVFADDPTVPIIEPPGGGGGSGREVTCYGRGVNGTIGYYYCDGISQCYWVSNANADTHTGARKCTL
jgi:hypothetical protein